MIAAALIGFVVGVAGAVAVALALGRLFLRKHRAECELLEAENTMRRMQVSDLLKKGGLYHDR